MVNNYLEALPKQMCARMPQLNWLWVRTLELICYLHRLWKLTVKLIHGSIKSPSTLFFFFFPKLKSNHVTSWFKNLLRVPTGVMVKFKLPPWAPHGDSLFSIPHAARSLSLSPPPARSFTCLPSRCTEPRPLRSAPRAHTLFLQLEKPGSFD